MIITYTGKKIDYNNIKEDDIDIGDICHSLPRINRFVGHSSRAYSVAEHTILGVQMCEKLGYTTKQQLLFLIHDFTEAYVGDCPSPLKALLPMFSEIEARVESAILDYIGLPKLTKEEEVLVKKIDLTMLALEMRDMTMHNYQEFVGDNMYPEMLDDVEFDLTEERYDGIWLESLLLTYYVNLTNRYWSESN